MRSMTDLRKSSKTARVTKVVCVCLTVGAFALLSVGIGIGLKSLFGAVFAAICGAYVLMPLQKQLEARLGKTVSALICVVVLYGAVVAAVVLLLPVLLEELAGATKQIGIIARWVIHVIGQIEDRINSMNIPISLDDVMTGITRLVNEKTGSLVNNVIDGVIGFVKGFPTLVMLPILTFYFLKDRAYFASRLEFVIPMGWRMSIKKFATGADHVIKSYIKTQLLLSLIVGALTAVGYSLLGVPYALLLGMLMGVFELIPYFGPVIAAVPACLLVLSAEPTKILWTLGVILGVQQLENNFLSPYLMGAHFDINPVTVIAVLWLFGGLFGFVGFIIAIPVYVIVKDLAEAVFNRLVKVG